MALHPARGFGMNGKSWYANVVGPREVFCQFTVNAADSGGLGITSLKSNGYVNNVFMHTSGTPATNNGMLNPNPPNGYILVQFKNNFNYYLQSVGSQVITPAAPTTASTVANTVYIITTLGTTTLAQWVAVGLPAGFTPAVGQMFVATATQAIGGTGKVGTAGIPSNVLMNVVGDPGAMLSNNAQPANAGAQLIIGCYSATASGNATLVATAPADSTVIRLRFAYDASSVTVDGI